MSPLCEHLGKVKSVTMHQRNAQVHAAEIFKVKNELVHEMIKKY